MANNLADIDKEISIRKILAVKNDTEQRKLGSLTYNIKCKWEKEAKKVHLRLVGVGRMRLCVGLKGYKRHRWDKNFSGNNKYCGYNKVDVHW